MAEEFAIGIGINLFDARALLINSKEEIMARIEKERVNISANETLTTILELFEDMVKEANKYKDRIKGVGLALGGIVDSKKGTVYWPQRSDSMCTYISVPLKKYLEEKFKLPVIIENDANACLWAEYKSNFGKYRNIIYLFSGVGCGLLINGELYRGKDGAAGELFINRRRVMRTFMGDYSFLSPWPADIGIINRTKELIAKGRCPSLIRKITATGEIALRDIISATKKGNKTLEGIIKEAAYSLGVKLSFLINLLNPELVVVGGGLEELGDIFLEELQRSVHKFSFTEMRRNLKITYSQLRQEATSLGAGLLILKEK